MNNKLVFLVITILFIAASGCSPAGLHPGEWKGWKVYPKKPSPPGTANPEKIWETGVWSYHIGAKGNVPGSPGSSISIEFDCGNNPTRYCTVTFTVLGVNLLDKEKAQVSLKTGGGPKQNKTRNIPSKGPGVPKEYIISVPGCTSGCKLSFGLTGGDSNNVQSSMQVTSVRSACTLEDKTSTELKPTPEEPLPGS